MEKISKPIVYWGVNKIKWYAHLGLYSLGV
jgi:hypothetical protein